MCAHFPSASPASCATTAEWPQHPEGALAAPGLVWASGLGGGAPWFPTTGVEAETSSVIEELFHTLQYTVLPPRAVCSYYALYRAAARRRLYTPRFLEGVLDPSEPAEPVPTAFLRYREPRHFKNALQCGYPSYHT